MSRHTYGRNMVYASLTRSGSDDVCLSAWKGNGLDFLMPWCTGSGTVPHFLPSLSLSFLVVSR